MTVNPTSISSHKLKKKYERIVKDIDSILLIFGLTQRSLKFFKNYVIVQEIVSILATNTTLLELQRKKYETELQLMKRESNE